jgi:hypothetical protein
MQVIRTFDRMQRDFENRIGAAELSKALDVVQRIDKICAAAASV